MWLLIVLLAMPLGCSSEPANTSFAAQPSKDESSTTKLPGGNAQQPPGASDITPPVGCPFKDGRETWDVFYLKGQKVGYSHTKIERVTVGGRPLVRARLNDKFKMLRFGELTETESQLTSHETPDGKFVNFVSIDQRGTTPVRTEGRVDGDAIVLTISGVGKTRTLKLPWSDLVGGHLSVENSLAAQPMKPGETRTLQVLVPSLHEIATTRLVASDFETTPLLHGAQRLLRVDQIISCGNQSLETTMWVDRKGQLLKTKMNAATIYRTTRAEALDETELGKFDIMLIGLVPVDRPIAQPHQTRRIRYKVSFTEGDPAGSLVAGTSQQVKSLGPTEAEVTVLAVRPDWPEKVETPRSDRPTLDDVNPNSLVQSDDPLIKKMAAEATQGKTDDWSKAVALERYVNEKIRDKNLSQGFASAAEVARTSEGDCTEHAVLLAALARTVDLPARMAMGLVYFERPKEPKHVFGYHMWTEIFVDGRWIPMDATLGLGGIGAAHLKLAHTSLKDANTMGAFMPVISVLDKIKIKILEIE